MISSASHHLPYGKVFIQTMCCSVNQRGLWGVGEKEGGCCFDFKVMCKQTVSVDCCHRNGCEPVCCASLIGTTHQKHCPFSSFSPHPCFADGKCHGPSKLGWTQDPFMHSTALPDLQADRTCQTRQRKTD